MEGSCEWQERGMRAGVKGGEGGGMRRGGEWGKEGRGGEGEC